MRNIADFGKAALVAYIEESLFFCHRFSGTIECLEAVERSLEIARLEQQSRELHDECMRLLSLPAGRGVRRYLALSQKSDRLYEQLDQLRSLPYIPELLPGYKERILEEIS